MKLLASDYDRTLFTSRNGIKLNVQAIKNFRDNGNKFAIVTGRTFMSIKNQIDFYGIPYDYLSCNDGSTIFDNQNNLVSAEYLNSYEINDILYYVECLKKRGIIDNIIFYNEYTNVFKTNNNIIELGFDFKSFRNINLYIREIQEIFKTVGVYKYPDKIYVRKCKNKSDAVNEIAKIENINPGDIFTIGDAKNDLEMIRDYNGYNMLISKPNLYKVSKGTVTSVRQLIKKIDK